MWKQLVFPSTLREPSESLKVNTAFKLYIYEKNAKIGKSIHKRKCKADDEVPPFFFNPPYLFFFTIFSPRSFNRYSNDVSCRNVSQDR